MRNGLGLKRPGCPTLAAFLLLRLRWDASSLYIGRRNALKRLVHDIGSGLVQQDGHDNGSQAQRRRIHDARIAAE